MLSRGRALTDLSAPRQERSRSRVRPRHHSPQPGPDRLGHDDHSTDTSRQPPGRRGRPRDRDHRRAAGPLRARGAPPPRPALRRRDAHHPQPGRRRGPAAGDLRQGVRRVPPVPARHQPQGVDVPHPHQHLHQHLPQAAARAAAVRRRRGRGLPAGPGRVAHLGGAEVGRGRRARAPARHRGEAGAAGAARGLPDGRLPRRRRGVRLQGDRRDHGHPHRHGDVAPAPRAAPAARPAHRLRQGPWLRHQEES